jgi:iron complex transport system permease protein
VSRGPAPMDSAVLRRGARSVLLPRRAGAVAAGLAAGLAAAMAVGLLLGPGSVPAADVVPALFGRGSRADVLAVQEFRLPRVIAGALAGAALGLAGCLVQTLARNRLATPELVGINDGAVAAVVLSTAGTVAGVLAAWWVGPAGAVVAAMVVVALAGGLGLQGYRVLVVGLGVGFVLQSVTNLALAYQQLESSIAVYGYTRGSLLGRDYEAALPAAVALLALLPAALVAGRRLALLRFGDDVSATLGLDVTRTRLLALALAVGLAGAAVGAAGPIAFVGLAAPILVGRLAGPARVPLAGSALAGATLVVAADTAGRLIGAAGEVPAGIVTSVLGGPFLLWVLLTDREARGF